MEYEAVVRAFRRVGVKETVLKEQRGNMDRILSHGNGYGLYCDDGGNRAAAGGGCS